MLADRIHCLPCPAHAQGQWSPQPTTASGTLTYPISTPSSASWPTENYDYYVLAPTASDLSGTVGDVLVWQSFGRGGDPPANQQQVLPVLVTAGVAGSDDDQGGTTFNLNNGYGDAQGPRTYSPSTGEPDVPCYLYGGVQSYGKHLIQVPVSGTPGGAWTATVSSITLSGTTTNAQYPGLPTVGAIATFQADTRTVDISSSNIDPSSHKGTVVNGVAQSLPNVRATSGAMTADSVVNWSSDLSEWLGESDLAATAANFQSPSYYWKVSDPTDFLYGDSGLQEQPGSASIQLVGDFADDNTQATYNEFPKTETYTVKVTDSDGTQGTNTYTVNWHLPEESWHKNGTAFQNAATACGTSNGPVNAGGSVTITVPPSGVDWSVPEQQAGGLASGTSIYVASLSDVPIAVPVVLGLVSYKLGLAAPPASTTYPEPGTLSQFSSDVGTQESIDAGNTSGVFMPSVNRMSKNLADLVFQSGNANAYFNGTYGTLSFNVAAYELQWQQNFLGDGYGVHGYTGSVSGFVKWPGSINYVFTWSLAAIGNPPA